MKIKSPAFLLFLLLFIFSCKTTTYYQVTTEQENTRVALESPSGDQKIEAMIAPYKEKLDATMNESLGELDVLLVKERPESNLGNWMADMVYEDVKELNGGTLDFAILNQGGIRVGSIGSGPLTRGEIFELMPFDNVISIMSAEGREVRTFLNHIASSGGWPISAELSFKIKEEKAIDISINGEPLDDSRRYQFVVPDYIAGGGSGSDMLKTMDRKDFNLLVRDLLIDHIKRDTKKGIVQTAMKEGRIINMDNE